MKCNNSNPEWKAISYNEICIHLENINKFLEMNLPHYVLKSSTVMMSDKDNSPERLVTFFHIFKNNVKAIETQKENFKKVLDSSFIFAKISQIELNNQISYACELLNQCPLEIIKENENFTD